MLSHPQRQQNVRQNTLLLHSIVDLYSRTQNTTRAFPIPLDDVCTLLLTHISRVSEKEQHKTKALSMYNTFVKVVSQLEVRTSRTN